MTGRTFCATGLYFFLVAVKVGYIELVDVTYEGKEFEIEVCMGENTIKAF